MTDRQLWVSVFNASLQSILASGGVQLHAYGLREAPKKAASIAKEIADEALKDAPEDHP